MIIGLIVAAVFGGQSLIKQSKIRSVISEINKYKNAINIFRMQYNALPGDFTKAQEYWGAGVSNGDGDKFIARINIFNSNSLSAWQHLSMANLLPIKYSGVLGSGVVPDVNLPSTNYSKNTALWFYSESLWNNFKKTNYIVLSGYNGTGWQDYQVNVLDVRSIDLKIDDGKPYLGQVIGYSDVAGACVPNGQRLRDRPPAEDVEYNLSNLNDLCTMHFEIF